ncbi:hypothetical protein LTR85_009810 [Meristemomyces frigidus]|nr:hypothetical protein LTR85_009810 [Meristemomyces frigidus]
MGADSGPVHVVINTPELLESVLLNFDITTLLLSQRVSHQFKATIDDSVKLQRALWFTIDPAFATNSYQLNPLLMKKNTSFRMDARSADPFELDLHDLGLLARYQPGSWQKMVLVQPLRRPRTFDIMVICVARIGGPAVGGKRYLDRKYIEAPSFGNVVKDVVKEFCYLLGKGCPLHDSHA